MNKTGLDSILQTCLKDAANIKTYLKWLSIRTACPTIKSKWFSLFSIVVFSLEIICSDSMLSFNWDICVFIWRCRDSFCILNINFFSNMWFENIFPLYMWPFHSVDDFLCYVGAFSLHHFHFCLLLLLLPCFGCNIQEIIAKTHIIQFLPNVSF